MDQKIEKTIERIKEASGEQAVLENEAMSRHTSFRIGGPADALVLVNNEDALSAVLGVVNEEGAEHMLIGNGSNLLISDEGYPGIAIKLEGDFERIEQDETKVTVGAARSMSSTAAFLTENGLAGFEFASGIPGSIGGAVFMNAGAYGGEIKDVCDSVRVMDPDGSNIRVLDNNEMDFSYRHSAAQDRGMIILSAVLRLTKDDPEEIAKSKKGYTPRFI